MDFWASLEHKIFYKYHGEVPGYLVRELTEAAATADEMDRRMEQLHTHVQGLELTGDRTAPGPVDLDEALLKQLWDLARETGQGPG